MNEDEGINIQVAPYEYKTATGTVRAVQKSSIVWGQLIITVFVTPDDGSAERKFDVGSDGFAAGDKVIYTDFGVFPNNS